MSCDPYYGVNLLLRVMAHSMEFISFPFIMIAASVLFPGRRLAKQTISGVRLAWTDVCGCSEDDFQQREERILAETLNFSRVLPFKVILWN